METSSQPISEAEEGSGLGGKILVSVGVVLTIGILALGVAQLSNYGDWPPFIVKSRTEALSLGETGDFIGGWANSLALVWLVVVAGLQYQALNVQRADLRATRDELKQTREEIKKQVDLMEAQTRLIQKQAEMSEGLLDLERKRTAVEFIINARPLLRNLLIEAAKFRVSDGPIRNELGGYSIRHLISTLCDRIVNALDDKTPLINRRGEVRRFADDTIEINVLFDVIEYHSRFISDNSMYKNLMDLKNVSHLYDRCKALQALADTAE